MMPSSWLAANPPNVPRFPSLTVAQMDALDHVAKINLASFDGMFWWSTVMAIIQVESGFRPKAFRQEPSGVASYGLMQVLDVTAKPYGIDNPEDMYDPETGIFAGLSYLSDGYDILKKDGIVSYDNLFAGYNEGYGAVERGRPDPVYVKLATTARSHWLPLDMVQTAWNNSSTGYLAETATISAS